MNQAAVIPSDLLFDMNVCPSTKVLFAAIVAFPDMKPMQLAKKLGVGVRRVYAQICELRKLGYVLPRRYEAPGHLVHPSVHKCIREDMGDIRKKEDKIYISTEAQGSADASHTPEPAKPAKLAPSTPEHPAFAAFWAIYPKRISRAKARVIWERAVNSGVKPEVIQAALEADVAMWKSEKREVKYIPHPDTWLNRRRWEDGLQQAAAAPKRMLSMDELRKLAREQLDAEGVETRTIEGEIELTRRLFKLASEQKNG